MALAVCLAMLSSFSLNQETHATATTKQLTSEDVLRSFRQDKFSYLEGIMAYAQPTDRSSQLLTTGKRAFCFCQYGVKSTWDFALVECDKMDQHCEATLYLRALTLSKQTKYKDAIKYLTSAIELAPQDVNCYRLRSDCYAKVGDLCHYLNDLSAAIKLSQSPQSLLLTRAAHYFSAGDKKRAMADLETVLKLDPKNYIASIQSNSHKHKIEWQQLNDYELSDLIASDKTNYRDGVAKYTALLQKKPRDPLILLKRSFCNSQVANFHASIADANALLGIEPKVGLAYAIKAAGYNAQKQYSKAIADAQQAIKYLPHDCNPYGTLATCYINEGRHTDAIRVLNHALEIDPQSTIYHYLRGIAYLRTGDTAKAAADADQGLALDPDDSRLLDLNGICECLRPDSHRCILYTELEKIFGVDNVSAADGIKVYSQRLQQAPNDVLALAKHAFCCYIVNNQTATDELTKDVERMQSHDATRQVAYYLRGAALYRLKKTRSAISDLNEAIRLCPYDCASYNFKGLCEMELQQPAKAIAAFTESIKLEPFVAFAYTHRANLYDGQLQVAKARADVEAGLRLQPRDELESLKVRMDLEEHDSTKALAELSKMIKKTNSPSLLMERVTVDRGVGRYAEVKQDCDVLIARKFNLPKTFQFRAEANMHLRNYKQAVDDFEKLRALHWDWNGSIESAECYFALGLFQKAIDDYTRVIAHEPSNVKAYLGRAKAYDKLSKASLASQDRAKAVEIHDDFSGKKN